MFEDALLCSKILHKLLRSLTQIAQPLTQIAQYSGVREVNRYLSYLVTVPEE